jgi:uncharacterized membrane protein (UPF0127 family)
MAIVLAAVLLGGALAVCARHARVPAEPPAGEILLVPQGTEVPAPPPGQKSRIVAVEVVSTRAAREKGLSGRRSLGEDAGMLFVYPRDEMRNFWMKDCLIALDIAYVRADGTVAKVVTLPPGAATPPGAPIPQASSDEPVRYVLEVQDGWFARRKLGAGARVDLASVVAGVVPE